MMQGRVHGAVGKRDSRALRSGLAVALAAALAVAALAPGAAAAVDPDDSIPLNPTKSTTSITGQVMARDGSAVAGAVVEAAVIGSDSGDGLLKRTVVSSAVSAANGAYTLRPSRLPVSTTGSVDVEVTMRSGDQERYAIVALPVATTSGGSVAASDVPEAATLNFAMGADAPVLAIGGATVEEAPSNEVTDSVPGPDAIAAPDLAASTAASASTQVCPSTVPKWAWATTSSTTRSYVPVQKITTKGNSKQSYTWDKSSSTKLEAAYTGAGGNYGSGGLSYSRVNQSGLGITMVADFNMSRQMKVEWIYKKYQKMCYNESGYMTRLSVYKWSPENITGGNLAVTSAPVWTCNRARSTIFQNSTTIAKTSSVTASNSYSIAGVKLDANNVNTTSNVLKITPKSTGARICGDTTYPASANRTQEVSK